MTDKKWAKLGDLFFGSNIEVATKISKQTKVLNKKNNKTLLKLGRIT